MYDIIESNASSSTSENSQLEIPSGEIPQLPSTSHYPLEIEEYEKQLEIQSEKLKKTKDTIEILDDFFGGIIGSVLGLGLYQKF